MGEVVRRLNDLLREAEERRRFEDLDRASAVICGAQLDEALAELLGSFLRESEASYRLLDSGLGGLYVRIELSHALGLISDWERSDLHIVRLVRNKFAHSGSAVSFEHEDIARLLDQFRMPKIPGFKEVVGGSKGLFEHVSGILHEMVGVRTIMAANQRRHRPEELNLRSYPL